MLRIFDKYTVQISDNAYVVENIEFNKTAEISFIGKNNNQINSEKLAFAEFNSIKKILSSQNKINLKNIYFDYENFQKIIDIYNINSQKIFPEIYIENAFFDLKNYDFNLENSTFNQNLTIKKSVLIAKKISFAFSKFKTKNIDLSYNFFKTDEFSFNDSKIKKGDFNFKGVIFSDSKKNFKNIKFKFGKKNFENIEFNNGDADFSGTDFGKGKLSFKISTFENGKINFENSIFTDDETSFDKTEFGEGDIIFKNSKFNNCKINFTGAVFKNGRKDFTAVEFGNGDITFKSCNFGNGKISFRAANFGDGLIDFHYSEFGKGDKIFDYAKFNNGGINFSGINFGTGKVSFIKTDMGNGNINFEASEFTGAFKIHDSVFGRGEFNFQNAQFLNAELEIKNVEFGLGKVSFKNSKFKTLSLKESQIDNFFELRLANCQMLDLSETVVKDILDINPPENTKGISGINLSGMRLLGRIYFDWNTNNVKELIYKQQTSNLSKSEQFRILKENYNANGQYSYEDKAYAEFKRCEAKALLDLDKEKRYKYNIIPYLNYYFKWLIFDKMGKYATDPLRVLGTMIITYLLFTLSYLIVAKFGNIHIVSSLYEPTDPRVLQPIGKAFYHSAITFLTIGYGDYYPDGISRWISAAEGFVGLFLMSYFTVAFVRKVLR